MVMEEAGIDTAHFKSHSTRAAAASSLSEGNEIPIDDVLKVAGWSHAKTFKRFYEKVIQQSS